MKLLRKVKISDLEKQPLDTDGVNKADIGNQFNQG
jgi:hypothetical protein